MGQPQAVKIYVSFEGEIRYTWEAGPKLFSNKSRNLIRLLLDWLVHMIDPACILVFKIWLSFSRECAA